MHLGLVNDREASKFDHKSYYTKNSQNQTFSFNSSDQKPTQTKTFKFFYFI